MSKNMEQIQSLCGMREFKALAEKLSRTAANARMRNILYPPCPNLLVLSASGSGITTVIRLLSGLLREEKLFRFIGEEAYFETSLSANDDDIDRILDRIRLAAGFYGQFRGVIGIEISDIDLLLKENRVMRRMMEFVDIEQGRILFVFVLPISAEARQVIEFQRLFVSRTPLEVLHLPFPATDEIIGFIRLRLEQRHMILTDDGAASLKPAVEKLRKDKQFKGFQSLNNLIDELVWRKLSRRDGNDGIIDRPLLASLFDGNGPFSVVQEDSNRGSVQRIGF